MTNITYEELERVNFLSGAFVKVEEFPRAKKPAFKVWADFGAVRHDLANICSSYCALHTINLAGATNFCSSALILYLFEISNSSCVNAL